MRAWIWLRQTTCLPSCSWISAPMTVIALYELKVYPHGYCIRLLSRCFKALDELTQSCIVTEFNEWHYRWSIFVTASSAARGTFLGTFPKLWWRRHEWLISHATRLPPHLLRITYGCWFLSLRADSRTISHCEFVISTCTDWEKLHLYILDRSQGMCGIKLQTIAYV